MPGLTAFYVVYPANLSSPSESDILAGWPGSAVASGSFPALEGLNEYTIKELPVDSNLNVAILIQDGSNSNIIISNFVTGQLLAYYVIYPNSFSDPSDTQILAGWSESAVASGSFPALEGLNEYTISELPLETNLNIAIIVQDSFSSNVIISNLSTGQLLAYYVIYPNSFSDPSDTQILTGWPGTALNAGSFTASEGLNTKEISGLSGSNLKIAIIVSDDVESNSLVASFLLNGLITYYVCYYPEVADPTIADIIAGWPGVAFKAGSFNTIDGYNSFVISQLAPGTTYKVALVSVAGDDTSNALSIVINTIPGTRPRSTRMPRMLLPFPRFRRYS